MTYQTELANNSFQTNIVVAIGDTPTYFAKYIPDSGLTPDYLTLSAVAVNPTSIDLKKVKTTIPSTTITINDKDGGFSLFMGSNENSLIGERVRVYLGRITGSFAWSDYFLINDYRVKSINKSPNLYKISAVSQTDLMQTSTFDKMGNVVLLL